jgi:ABC-2 type transport system permease protein
MNRLIALVKKEFLQLWRDPRLIGFVVMAPVIFLILFGLALKLEPQNVKMAFVDQDASFFSHLIKTNIWNEGYFQLYPVADERTIVSEIRDGKARAGLFIGKEFSAELVENAQPLVKMYVDGTMPSLATAMDNNAGAITDDKVTNDMYFLDADAENVVIAPDPFVLDLEILFNPDKKETWFFLPGVVGVLIMQVALILTSTAVVREKENNTLEQMIVSPITRTQFILGKILPYVLIAFADFYFILVLGWLLFDLPSASSQLLLFMLAFVYVAGLIALGLAISTASQTQQQAMFLSIFILVPSILLSGFVFPIEAMPSYIRPVAYLLPFTYFVEIIRGILLKGNSFFALASDYAALSAFAAVFTLVSIRRFQKTLG